MKSFKLTIVVFPMIVLHIVQSFGGDFDIKFGLMKKYSDGKYYVYSETTTIPLIYKDKDPDFWFGYSIKTLQDKTFTTYMIIHVPSAFEKFTGEFKEAEKQEGGKAVQSPAKIAVGKFTYLLRFDRGDPPGRYNIDIWINDNLVKTIDFEVIEAK